MSLKKFAYSCLFAAAFSFVAACGRELPEEQVSEQKMDFNLPDRVSYRVLARSLVGVNSLMREGKHNVALADVAQALGAGGALQTILSKRDPKATLECKGRKCLLTSKGRATNLGQGLPGTPVADIKLEGKIEVWFWLHANKKAFEVCDVNGIKVNAALFDHDINGLAIVLGENRVSKFLINAGINFFGGEFPSDGCKLN